MKSDIERDLEEFQSKNPVIMSKRTESGIFTRTMTRCGKKKTQKTRTIGANLKKVIFGHIGEMEVYIYPYDFPNRVFIGKFPYSTALSRTDVNGLFGMAQICMWFLNGEAFKTPKKSKAANARRRAILSAYNYAQNAQRSSEKASESPNYNYSNIAEPNKKKEASKHGKT